MPRKSDTIIIPKGKKLTPELALGLVVRKRREELGLQQSDLESGGGVSRSYISRVEHGLCEVSIGRFMVIAEALDLTSAELMQEVTERLKRGK